MKLLLLIFKLFWIASAVYAADEPAATTTTTTATKPTVTSATKPAVTTITTNEPAVTTATTTKPTATTSTTTKPAVTTTTTNEPAATTTTTNEPAVITTTKLAVTTTNEPAIVTTTAIKPAVINPIKPAVINPIKPVVNNKTSSVIDNKAKIPDTNKTGVVNDKPLDLLANVFENKRPMTTKEPLPPLPPYITPFIVNAFEEWKDEYQIDFDITQIDGRQKLVNFADTMLKCEQHNKKFEKGEVMYMLKPNSRAILSLKEKRDSMNGLTFDKDVIETMKIVQGRAELEPQPNFPPAPDSLDYRKLGYVTDVVDQGFYCSSCYAFAAQGSLESAIFKKYGKLQKLSEQVIIDCSKNDLTANYGCRGGWMSAVYEYIIGNNGTEAASTYPLRDVNFPCKFNATRAKVFLKSYGYVIGDEEVLKRALAAIGPLSVGINGENESIYSYWKGVYDEPTCSGNINHAVILVGYGTDYSYTPPLDYWILKNSWGKSWGEDGYIRLLRGKKMCGISSYTVYPVV